MKTADSAVYLCIYTELYSNSVIEQCPLLQVCVHLNGSNAENTFHCWLYSVVVHVTKKKKVVLFLQNRYPIMVKCSNIGKPIYRSISSSLTTNVVFRLV